MAQTPHPESYCARYLNYHTKRDTVLSCVVHEAFDALSDQYKMGRSVNWPLLLQALTCQYDPALLRRAVALAECWVTCACGNQCESLPRMAANSGEPEDPILSKLGIQFCDLLKSADSDGNANHSITAAARILQQIEARSAHLLQQLT